MNPIDKVAEKEGEYEINALGGAKAVFLRAKSSRALLRKHGGGCNKDHRNEKR